MEHGRSELHKIFSEALRNASAEQAPILAWPMVCGASVAKKTRALDFIRGVLRIQVPDKAWMKELEAIPRVRATAKLGAFLGGVQIA